MTRRPFLAASQKCATFIVRDVRDVRDARIGPRPRRPNARGRRIEIGVFVRAQRRRCATC